MATGGEDDSSKASSEDKIWGISDFKILEFLGKGAFGQVYLVEKEETGKPYAMKVIPKADVMLKPSGLRYVQRERTILEAIGKQTFLPRLHFAFQTKAHFVFVTEFFAGGTLYQLLDKIGPLREEHTKFYVAEIVVALEKLHKMGVLYRDLKPENILLDSSGHISLVDFGLAIKYPDFSKLHKAFSFSGSPEYLAPEVFKRKPYSFEVDWWTLGVVTYIMLTDRFPFKGSTMAQTARMVMKISYSKPKDVSPACLDFLKELLMKNPSTRLGSNKDAVEVQQHHFFQDINWDDVSERKLTPPCIFKMPLESSSSFERVEGFELEEDVLPKEEADRFEDFYFVSNED